jgi:double-stranded uracil-DNA glycosylase
VKPLRDVVPPRPRLLLVGINPGLRSGAVGHHFAGNGNPFWRLLHASGITPVALDWENDQRLGDYGIALTNLCPRATRTAAELTAAEIARGRRVLVGKAEAWRPAAVALVGVTLYRMVFGKVASAGPGPKPETLGGAPVFVVPNPSGLNASFPGFSHKLVWFEKLNAFMAALGPASSRAGRGYGRRRESPR